MKRLVNILLVLLWVSVPAFAAHQYTSTSRLATGKFVKIAVNQTGVCKITYESLQAMGLNPSAIRVYGFGGGMLTQDFQQAKIDDLPAVPIYMHKGSDGVFGAGDYILFYAQGPVSWQYTGSRFRHTTNTYSQYGFYFLSDNAGEQHLLEQVFEPVHAEDANEITNFADYRLHELDSINLIDKSGMSGGGREFYGEQFTMKRPNMLFSYTFPNIDSSESMRAYVDVAASASERTSFIVKIGNTQRTLYVNAKGTDHVEKAKTAALDANYSLVNGDKQSVSLKYSTTEASAEAFLNYVEVTAYRKLILTDDILYVRNPKYYGSGTLNKYVVTNATTETQVWDVTNLDNIYAVPTDTLRGDTLTFVLDNDKVHELVILNPSRCATISSVPFILNGEKMNYRAVGNQNLHRLESIDFVIIAPEQFASIARELATVHEQEDGLTTAVVTDQQVYNEFSSGTPDATAYRWLMKMLYDRAVNSNGLISKPRYLMLFGDGSFDNRKLLTTSAPNTLLTYQGKNSVKETSAYATDDYFTWMEDREGNNDILATMDLSVGRLPVNKIEDAQKVVQKLIRYLRNETAGSWKTQVVFLADDGDSNMHTKGADKAAESLRLANPNFVVNKIYTDSYQQELSASGESYPLAKNKFDNLLKDGVLLFDYCGHAGYNNISSESMLTAREIREMTNENLGLWMLATCNFANFDSQKTSAAEEAVLNEKGGALAVFAACRTVYAAQNEVINKNICDSLFAHRNPCDYPYTIGDAIRFGKNMTARDENNLPYVLLGDPAVKLRYPTDYQVGTISIPDTLRALSVNALEGCILTADGDTATWFNGKVQVTIFDKMQTLSTKDNDQPDPAKKSIYKFLDYPNTIFKGEARVENGFFTSTFMMPKDIKYNFGNARIVYYAQDTITYEEGTGHFEDFVVGGSSSVQIVDSVGPELRLYLNNPAFVNGGKTNEYPHFYAEVYDENGINTVGSGIGHDLQLTLDGDPTKSFVLNNYFKAQTNSYQAGLVSYRMSEVSEGHHSLSFRAWDLLNNSNTATLDFEVVKGYAVQIFSVMTYPNPVHSDSMITFVVQHDKPDNILQMRYMIYDLSGRKVWERTQEGNGQLTISTSEARLTPGLYVYQVELKMTDQMKYTSKAGKIMVY